MANSVKASMGCGIVVFLILLLGGVRLLVTSVEQYEQAHQIWRMASVVPGVIGAGLVLGALAYLKFARRIVREGQVEAALEKQFPGQPWKTRKLWRGASIAADGRAGAVAMWLFALFWNAVSAPGVWAFFAGKIPHKVGYLILLFPLIGLGLLGTAIYLTLQQRKFGRAKFVPTSLPGVIGGYLGGVIEVSARVELEMDARLSLKCVRRETRGSGKHQSTTDHVLWEDEVRLSREKWVTGVGGTRIPVLFYIPAGCAATDESDRRNVITWRLEAKAPVAGVDFAARFIVPVYATGDTAPPPVSGAPLLQEYAAPVLDAATLRACGVRQEGGAFQFSARHLWVARVATAIVSLGMLALLASYWGHGIPGVVWGITLFVGFILSLFTLDVWCDRFELRVEGTEVVVTRPRPWGTKITRVPRAEVAQITAEKAMTSGEKQFFRLMLVGTAGQVVAGAKEPFRVKKLRYQLAQRKKKGGLTAAEEQTLVAGITAELQRLPKFTVQFAKHIPGRGMAEAIGALVLATIRAK